MILPVLDLALISSCFLAAYYARFHSNLLVDIMPPPEFPPWEPYLKISVLAGFVWVFLLWKERAYDSEWHFTRPVLRQIRSVFVSGLISMAFLMMISFMIRHLLLSRLAYLIGFCSACTVLTGTRLGLDFLEHRVCRLGFVLNRTLFMGWTPRMMAIVDRMKKLNHCSQIIGMVGSARHSQVDGDQESRPPWLGNAGEIEEIHTRVPFQQLIIVNQGEGENGEIFPPETLIRVVNFCERKGVAVYVVPDFLEILVRAREVGSFSGVPFIQLKDASLHPVYSAAKRFLDIFLSTVVLVGGAPLWAAIALLVKLTSKGPVLFVQERVGLHGKRFKMLKFRSMVDGAEKMLEQMVDFDNLTEPVFKIKSDPRVTGIGKFLRRTGLDEIPQFVNVLTNSMSIVGPRPEQSDLVERYDDFQKRRLKAKPGITGYQQVMNRGEPALAKRIEHDLYYLKYQSLWLDLYIMLRTVYVLFRGEGITF